MNMDIEALKAKLDRYNETNDITLLIDAQQVISKLVRQHQDSIRKLYACNDYEV